MNNNQFSYNLLNAVLEAIESDLLRVMENITQESYESENPFRNTGNTIGFHTETFEVRAYDWGWDNDESGAQPYNFKWRDLEIYWYKYCGRGLYTNRATTHDELALMLDECLESLRNYERRMEKMISKETFIERLGEIFKAEEEDDKLDQALYAIAPSDFTGFARPEYREKLLRQLQEDTGDTGHDYIGWWIYDCQKGNCETDEDCTIYIDGKPFVVRTASDLYDLLVYDKPDNPPTEAPEALARKAQKDGVRYAINVITKIRHTNRRTNGMKANEYEALLSYISDKIRNEYAIDTGIIIDESDDQEITIFSNEEE